MVPQLQSMRVSIFVSPSRKIIFLRSNGLPAEGGISSVLLIFGLAEECPNFIDSIYTTAVGESYFMAFADESGSSFSKDVN